MKFFLLVFLLPVFCYGQGDQTIIKVPIDPLGTPESAILHLPDDYKSTTTKYPIMVFLHGIGEGGNNPATIYNSSSAGGPAYYIGQKAFPSSFVNPADGKSYKYIIVSPQSTDGWSTTAQQLDYILTYLINTYRVDPARVYLTGLSAGGEGIMEYIGKETGTGVKVNTTHPIAALIPMSAVMNGALITQYATTIVSNNVHTWGFGSLTDTHGANTLSLIWLLNVLKGNLGLETTYPGGHCCWGQFYNPDFRQNGMNIYQWALQYTKGTPYNPDNSAPPPPPPPPTVPTANAGADQTITLPTNQVVLNGAISTVTNGTISKYAWVQRSGPSTAAIAAASSVTTTVTGLSAGTYAFALTITDNTNKTSSASVQVMVKPAVVVTPPVSSSQAIPGVVQAESYSSMSGVQTQATTDAGSGLNVGWIDNKDWMNYTVNAASAGVYPVSFRVATPYSGASFQLRNSSGTVLATVNVPSTGDFQKWTTVTANVTLPAGVQTLQIYSATGLQWNFNWMQFGAAQPLVQAIPGMIQAESYSNMAGIATEATTDAGAGLDVGWIDNKDWMNYNVNAAAAGTYPVSFRVASPYTGASFQLRSSSGAVLATVNVPSTGDFQKWTTVTANVPLPAGVQTLQIYSTTSGVQWNFNWMQFGLAQPLVQAIPGTIQAESYSNMAGIATQATMDAGGGLNVGWIDQGNWMSYIVNATKAQTYTASFRVASPYTGAGFQLRSSSGAVLATVKVPSTGDFQKWTTVTAKVTLPAGNQTLQIYSTTSGVQWNFNWMQFASEDDEDDKQGDAMHIAAVSATSRHLLTDSAADGPAFSFLLYPNPVHGQFMIQLNNGHMGTMRVQIVDVTGVIRQTYNYNKNQSSMQLTLSAGDLPAGTYFVRVQIGAWIGEVKKIIKI